MLERMDVYNKDSIQKVAEQPAFQDELIQYIADGFEAFEDGDFFNAPIQTLGVPPMAPFVEDDHYAAQTCVKSGYFRNNPFYVIKVASGGHPWEENSGMMQIYSQKTGKLEALLLDQGILTEVRTAAVAALVIQIMLPAIGEVKRVGVLGTGVQARYQMQLAQRVLRCRDIGVYGRSREKVEVFKSEMTGQGWESIDTYSAPDVLLQECDIIITTTTARSPVLGNTVVSDDHLKCRLIICIGADAPGKAELTSDLLDRADFLVADSVEQSIERGEFQRVQNPARQEAICSLGALIKNPPRKLSTLKDRKGDPLTIFDSSGVALQDCVIAQLAYSALRKKK